MKKTICEKAVEAVNQLNKTALLMHKQMKSGEINAALLNKDYLSAHKKVKAWRKSYLIKSFDSLNQFEEFRRSGLDAELETANDRFGRVLKHYAKAVGAVFVEAEKYDSRGFNSRLREIERV